MVEAWAEVAAVDADDDAEFFSGRELSKKASKVAGEEVEIVQFVPLHSAFDEGVESAAEKRNEPDRLIAGLGMEPVQGLEPEKRKFDRVFAVMRGQGKEAGRIDVCGEAVDEIGRAFGFSERSEVIAPVEIPLERRAVANPENEIGVGQGHLQERMKGSGVGTKGDAEIDMRSNDAEQRTFPGCGRHFGSGEGFQGLAKKIERSSGIGRIAIGVMSRGE